MESKCNVKIIACHLDGPESDTGYENKGYLRSLEEFSKNAQIPIDLEFFNRLVKEKDPILEDYKKSMDGQNPLILLCGNKKQRSWMVESNYEDFPPYEVTREYIETVQWTGKNWKVDKFEYHQHLYGNYFFAVKQKFYLTEAELQGQKKQEDAESKKQIHKYVVRPFTDMRLARRKFEKTNEGISYVYLEDKLPETEIYLIKLKPGSVESLLKQIDNKGYVPAENPYVCGLGLMYPDVHRKFKHITTVTTHYYHGEEKYFFCLDFQDTEYRALLRLSQKEMDLENKKWWYAVKLKSKVKKVKVVKKVEVKEEPIDNRSLRERAEDFDELQDLADMY